MLYEVVHRVLATGAPEYLSGFPTLNAPLYLTSGSIPGSEMGGPISVVTADFTIKDDQSLRKAPFQSSACPEFVPASGLRTTPQTRGYVCSVR